MTSAFSSFSLKRNRSASSNKGLNALLSKISNSFHHHKKRRQKKNENKNERRSSLSTLIDYFRSVDNNSNSSSNSSQSRKHPFANDSIFEYKRYTKNQDNTTHHKKQQGQKQKYGHDSKIIFAGDSGSIHSSKNPPTLLVNNKLQKNHRHTNSTISQRHTSTKKSRHARHYSHVSCISTSNITVNSENLTAKEFADIAGIRILSDDENYATAHSQLGDSKILKRCAVCDELDDDNVINNQSSMVVISRVPSTHAADVSSSVSSCSSSSPPPLDAEEDEPQIWDTDFWCRPGAEKSDAVSIQSQAKPPILGDIKLNTTDTIIKKGRFEIHLAPNDTCNTKSSLTTITHPDVVEWKRKKKPPSQ